MSSSKTINISPQLFKVKSNKPTRKHIKHQSNKMNKHKLMNRLKQHMSTQKNPQPSDQTLSNFDKHLSYFQKLNKERKKTRSRNKKENVFTALPSGMKSQAVSECLKEATSHYRIKPAPEYGILKGASKPTMREWKRSTQKNMHYVPAVAPPTLHVQEPIPPSTNLSLSANAHGPPLAPPPVPPPAPMISTSRALAIIPPVIHPSIPPPLASIPPPLASKCNLSASIPPPLASKCNLSASIPPPLASIPPPLASIPPPLASKCNLSASIPPNRKTFLLGKRANKIGVLIKNNRTRKRIKEEINILNAAPIYEVKEYLKKHQLYKAGNNTPQDVLREIYKSAHLAGKPVKNKSAENLLHNFYKL